MAHSAVAPEKSLQVVLTGQPVGLLDGGLVPPGLLLAPALGPEGDLQEPCPVRGCSLCGRGGQAWHKVEALEAG